MMVRVAAVEVTGVSGVNAGPEGRGVVPEPAAASTGSVNVWWALTFVALTTALTLQTFRVLFPEAYGLADRRGNEVSAVVILVVFATPLLAPVLRRFVPARPAAAVLAVALAGWRLAVPAFAPVPLAVALAGTVVALMALTLVLSDTLELGPDVVGTGLLTGVGLDVAVRAGFATWDPVWQRGVMPLLVAGLLCVGLVVSATGALGATRRRTDTGDTSTVALGAGPVLGALLAFEFLFLASPGFVASSGRISLAWATMVVLAGVGLALASFAVASVRPSRGLALGLGAALAGIGFLLPRLSGGSVVLAVAAGQVAVGGGVAVALRARRPAARAPEMGIALGWLAFVLTVMLYQIHFDRPLPFDNRWIIAAAGALVALAAAGHSRFTARPSAVRPAGVVAAAALTAGVVVAAGLAATGVHTSTGPVPAALRVVEWNVRQGVGSDGNLDPDAIASVLERGARPDIVVLPEVARGWPVSGDLDLASWLSRRLGLPFVWGPAADNQFGTLVLSRLPVTSVRLVRLPVAGSAQRRSAVRATLDLGRGRHLVVLATHLQHHNDQASMAARMREIDLVLREWGGAGPAILVGDLNPRQGDPPGYPPRHPGEFAEVRALLAAGFVTAQDLAACPHPTSGRNCSDFVLVTPDLDQRAEVVNGVTSFDHRPVVSAVQLR